MVFNLLIYMLSVPHELPGGITRIVLWNILLKECFCKLELLEIA